MSVPKYYEFFGSLLRALKDGELHTAKEIRTFVALEMNLSGEDLVEMLPSGRQTTFSNRIAWARTYLNKAGLIETPVRGRYQITAEGKKALEAGETIDLDYLGRYPSFRAFYSNSTNTNTSAQKEVQTEEENTSPLEILDAAYGKVTAALASQLMDEVIKLTPAQFEQLVVKLLLKMGYGDGIDEAGMVTSLSKDGGIDGIIKEDLLGFDTIYIQAKKWAAESTVDRTEVQKFTGALHGVNATKGLFITTAQFSKNAKEFAANLNGLKVVLIDGNQLMKLMIKYNLGVSVEHCYEIKRIDSDFFNDSL